MKLLTLISLLLCGCAFGQPIQRNRFTTNADGVVIDGGVLINLNPANIAAGTAGINITGNAATATTAASFSGNLVGDVTGTQGATVLSHIPAISGTNLTVLNATNLVGQVPSNSLNGVNGAGLTNLTVTNIPGTLTNKVIGSNVVSIANTNGASAANAFIETAGNSTNAGSRNTAFGDVALGKMTNGSDNTAIGQQALQISTNGNYNTAVGSFSLRLNTNGQYNTGVGVSALNDNAAGAQNTGVGFDVMYNGTSNTNNTGVGVYALFNNLSGDSNTAVGVNALYNLGSASTGGSNNIAIGAGAGSNFNNNESGNIDIGNIGSQGENNITRIGSNQITAYIAGVITGNGGGLTNVPAGDTSVAGTNIVITTVGTTQTVSVSANVLTNNNASNVNLTNSAPTLFLNGGTSSSDGVENVLGGVGYWLTGGSSNDWFVQDVPSTHKAIDVVISTEAVTIYSNLTVNGSLYLSTGTNAYNGNGSGLTNLNASSLASGTIPQAQLPSAIQTLNSNNGGNLTNLGAANVTGSGLLPDAVLSTNVPLLNAPNTFTSNMTISLPGIGGLTNGAELTIVDTNVGTNLIDGIAFSNAAPTSTTNIVKTPGAIFYAVSWNTNTSSPVTNAFAFTAYGITNANNTGGGIFSLDEYTNINGTNRFMTNILNFNAVGPTLNITPAASFTSSINCSSISTNGIQATGGMLATKGFASGASGTNVFQGTTTFNGAISNNTVIVSSNVIVSNTGNANSNFWTNLPARQCEVYGIITASNSATTPAIATVTVSNASTGVIITNYQGESGFNASGTEPLSFHVMMSSNDVLSVFSTNCQTNLPLGLQYH